jgi:hypothetical protein
MAANGWQSAAGDAAAPAADTVVVSRTPVATTNATTIALEPAARQASILSPLERTAAPDYRCGGGARVLGARREGTSRAGKQ